MIHHGEIAPPTLRTIIIVDDNPRDVDQLREPLVETEDYLVEDYPTAEAALERSRRNEIHAIVIDIGLPGMDGVTLARRLRQKGVGAPIMLVSANIEPWHEEAARSIYGCIAMHKDTGSREYVRALEDLIEQCWMRGQICAIGTVQTRVETKVDALATQIEALVAPQRRSAWASISWATLVAYRGIVTACITLVLTIMGYVVREHPNLAQAVEQALEAMPKQ